jgi:S-adenosyl methyltransferase
MLRLARLGYASRNTRSWHREEGCTVSDRPSTLSRQEMPELNTGFPHTARVWNHWLGGKDNFPADADAAEVSEFCAVGRKP